MGTFLSGLAMSRRNDIRKPKSKRRTDFIRESILEGTKQSLPTNPTDVPFGLDSHPMWIDEQGVHAMIPGEKPDEETLTRMTKVYQQKIRQSPLFDEMVKTYGAAEAEALLLQCRAELR